jgi:hypothetical protein
VVRVKDPHSLIIDFLERSQIIFINIRTVCQRQSSPDLRNLKKKNVLFPETFPCWEIVDISIPYPASWTLVSSALIIMCKRASCYNSDPNVVCRCPEGFVYETFSGANLAQILRNPRIWWIIS